MTDIRIAADAKRRWLHRMGHHHGRYDSDCSLCQRAHPHPNGHPDPRCSACGQERA